MKEAIQSPVSKNEWSQINLHKGNMEGDVGKTARQPRRKRIGDIWISEKYLCASCAHFSSVQSWVKGSRMKIYP